MPEKNLEDFLVVPYKTAYERLMVKHNYNHDAVMKKLVFDRKRKEDIDNHEAAKRILGYLRL